MNIASALNEISSWPLPEQIELAQQLWDRLVESGWQPELTDEQKADLDRRLEALDANPNDVISWDEVVQRVRHSQ